LVNNTKLNSEEGNFVIMKKIEIKREQGKLIIEENRLSNKKLMIMIFLYFILSIFTIFINIEGFNNAKNIIEIRNLILLVFFVIFYNCMFGIMSIILVDFFKKKNVAFDENFIKIKDNQSNLMKKTMKLRESREIKSLRRAKVEKSENKELYSLILEFKDNKEITLWTEESFGKLKEISVEINKFINK